MNSLSRSTQRPLRRITKGLNLAEGRQVQTVEPCGGGEEFLGPWSLRSPFPNIPPRIPEEGSQLPRTGLSSFTLLAASPISSQKLPNSSLESLQLPKLAIFSSRPQLL